MIDQAKYEEAARAIEHDILAKELPLVAREYGVYAPLMSEPAFYQMKQRNFQGVCAVGCYLAGREATSYDEIESAAYHLRVKRAWVEGVVQGFDGGEDKLGSGCYEEAVAFRHGHNVGKYLRVKYLPLHIQYLVPGSMGLP